MSVNGESPQSLRFYPVYSGSEYKMTQSEPVILTSQTPKSSQSIGPVNGTQDPSPAMKYHYWISPVKPAY